MDRWSQLKEWVKQESLRVNSFTISTILILEKMREIEEDNRREIRAIYHGSFDGED